MALSDPLLQSEDDGTPSTSGEGGGDADRGVSTGQVVDGDDGDDETQQEEEENSDDVLGGLILWHPISLVSCQAHHHRRYPVFQWGYGTSTTSNSGSSGSGSNGSTAVRGNPLPARIGSTVECEQAWKELTMALDIPLTKFQNRRNWIVGWTIAVLLTVLPTILMPVLHRHPTEGIFLFPLLNLSIIFVSHILLKCYVETPMNLAVKNIVISNNPVLKEQARVRMRIQKKTYPILTMNKIKFGFTQQQQPSSEPSDSQQPQSSTSFPLLGAVNGGSTSFQSLCKKCCCPCLFLQDTILLFETYVPINERQAQIAFV